MKKEKFKLSGEYFCGNKASDYAIKNGFLDYMTLAKAFDAVSSDIICTEDSLHCEVTNNKSPLYVYEKDYTFLILPVNIIATPEEIITAIKKLADAA